MADTIYDRLVAVEAASKALIEANETGGRIEFQLAVMSSVLDGNRSYEDAVAAVEATWVEPVPAEVVEDAEVPAEVPAKRSHAKKPVAE